MGTLALAKTPPSLPVSDGVKRSVPEPCESVELPQVKSGPVLLLLPLAVRHAALPPLAGAVGSDNEPAGPSTVLSWNGWSNRTVPAARALGADAVIPAVIMLSTSVTDTAHGIIRRTSRETVITRLLFRVARSVLRVNRPGVGAHVAVRLRRGRSGRPARQSGHHLQDND